MLNATLNTRCRDMSSCASKTKIVTVIPRVPGGGKDLTEWPLLCIASAPHQWLKSRKELQYVEKKTRFETIAFVVKTTFASAISQI